MKLLKSVYNVFRSIIISVIVLIVFVYLGLYVVLSVPAVQNKVKEKACSELSSFLQGRIVINNVTINPFSEVILTGVTLDSPEGIRCASIEKVAAGIDLWKLMADWKIILNYAEIIGFNAHIVQPNKHSQLNIQFIIDALTSKEKDKPSSKFDIKIRNIVVRDSKIRFSRPWMVDSAGIKQRFSDIEINGLRVDLNIPVLRNNEFKFDIRNIQFDAFPLMQVRRLSAETTFIKDSLGKGADQLSIKDLNITLPHSNFFIGDVNFTLNSIHEIPIDVEGSVTPSDFSRLIGQLKDFDSQWDIKTLAKIYDGNNVAVSEFKLFNDETKSSVQLISEAKQIDKIDSIDISLQSLKAEFSSKLISDVITILPNLSDKGKNAIQSAGRICLNIDGILKNGENIEAKGDLATERGTIQFKGSAFNLKSHRPKLNIEAEIDDLELDKLLATDKVGKASLSIDADITGFDKNSEGKINLSSNECSVLGNLFSDVELHVDKRQQDIDVFLNAKSEGTSLGLKGHAFLAGNATKLYADMNLAGLKTSRFGMKGKLSDCEISGHLQANTVGTNADNLTGTLSLNDLNVSRSDGMNLNLSQLNVRVDSIIGNNDLSNKSFLRDIQVESDWINAKISGYIHPSSLAKEMQNLLGSILPTLFPFADNLQIENDGENLFSYNIDIEGTSAPYAFFETPLRPLTNIPICGVIDTRHGKASLKIDTPHLQQGKNKLIRNLNLSMELDAFLETAKINSGLIFPAKKGDAEIMMNILAIHDKVNVNLGINPTLESVVKGNVAMTASFCRLPDPYKPKGELALRLDFHPSSVKINDKAWVIAESGCDYSGKRISINNFKISHEDQFIKIYGSASESTQDKVKVCLNDIDLEYIFNILNINYVSFGGMATGEVVGSRLLTNAPEATTKYLRVKNLSYNGAVLGDGNLASDYDASSQKIGIYAVIRDQLTRQRKANVQGGIWVTRDSLSFNFDADRVNVGIMKPFVSAFCSDLYGEASGKCKLFGTFSDIDLIGNLKADSISMKLDFTNTWYHAGNDSVFLKKGLIDIPPLTLYDDEGHTAELSGWLRHTYFHNPVFSFRLRDAKSLLCYDTNEKINPLWYGTIYGSGHAQINGHPGLIDIDMNMSTEEGSKFYYIISDAEDIAQYSFLTFTDKRKENHMEVTTDIEPEYLKKFRKQNEDMESESSNVILSIKGTVTNEVLVTLVMDPKAGDNISARGQGALQMDYNLASNDLRMIGTYVLDEGNYNFTLQDIIIKNFNIKKGSLIKFDGDPMNAVLDIAATYRVNTNLTDLDKNFSTDKELNRTNVPVDAVLLVNGPMTNPDITFDIELPTLTSDVERKVKSLVSTNDMMSRQIIYLLALNRFYTPEYTGGQSNGSEWSSMASSTISSQLSNILSQMTDKLDVAPSFRSDKGDFTDMEFDLALSSRLLNNRLLINGNFGYRDKNTSNTQFVGDFDIEYLLNKNGNLRLKAYNHFNDQNYYLRSALTTQGVGVVFQRDFDRLFMRKKEIEKDTIREESNGETSEMIMEDLSDHIESSTDSVKNIIK